MQPDFSSFTRCAWVSIAAALALGVVLACGSSDTATSADLEPAPAIPTTGGVTALGDSSIAFTAPPPDGDREPPTALLEACEGIAVGSACTFVGREGNTVAGTCSSPPWDSDIVVCRPNDRPDRERPDRDPEARERFRAMARAACSGLSDGGSCSVDGENRSYTGTCRVPPEGDSLACVPDRFPRNR